MLAVFHLFPVPELGAPKKSAMTELLRVWSLVRLEEIWRVRPEFDRDVCEMSRPYGFFCERGVGGGLRGSEY